MDNDTYLLKPRVSRNATPSQLSIPVGSVRKLHETASIDHSYPELQLPTICWQPVFLVGICTSIAFGDFSAIFLVRLLPPPTRCTFGSPFLTYLFSADNQKKYAESLGSPSAFMDVDAKWAPDSIVEGVNNAVSSAANIGFTNEKPAGFSGDDAGRMVQDLLAGKYTAEEFAKAYEAAWDAGF